LRRDRNPSARIALRDAFERRDNSGNRRQDACCAGDNGIAMLATTVFVVFPPGLPTKLMQVKTRARQNEYSF
jgi:hypothetical protein